MMTLSASRLKELLHYEPATGIFTVIKRRGNQLQIGDVAGHTNKRGYVVMFVDGRGYLAHRLAWLYMTGVWPSEEVDHINCNTSDNRFCNLREASRVQNAGNARARRDNKIGLKGVCYHKHSGLWRARISINGRERSLGYFPTPDAAHAAYAAAAKDHYGEFARAA